VLEETFKILRCGGSARAFELLRSCGALPVVLPSLGAALDGWDDRRRRSFFAHLAALDRLVRSGEEVSEAVLLGALVMHLGEPAEPDEEGGEIERASARGASDADALLASLVQTSRLPRKIAERVRLAIHAQRGLREPQRRKRRRGRGSAGQPSFQDAVQLLRITVEATGVGQELLTRVAAQAQAHSGAPGERDLDHDRDGDGEREGEAAVAGRHRRPPAPVRDAAPERDAPEQRNVEGERGEPRTVDIGGGEALAEGADGQPGARKRRRRRGGRRRHRRGVGDGESGGNPAPSSGTAAT
jgi:poly(A) polymerase